MNKLKTFGNGIAMILCPIATFYLFEWYTHNPWTTMRIPIQGLNIFFFEMVMLLLFGIGGSLRIALLIETILFMLIGLANYYVILFRSAPIMPWDIYSFRTAASVADNFQYTLEKETLFVIFLFLILILIESRVSLRITRHKRVIRPVMAVVAFLLLYAFTSMLHQDSTIKRFRMYDKLFTPTVMSKRDGTAVAFLMELKYIKVDKPSSYSAKDAEALLSSYAVTDKGASEKLPNIIVIMNEAFSDPAILGDFPVNKDYMPFVHALLQGKENTVSGLLNVSVLGGNTANTEFEFLTGHSMAFLPQGSIPFQQYIQKDLPSLASHLQQLGYQTIAMHPYNSTGWERNTVYPMLGFEETRFIKDWKNPEKIRKYVSDRSAYEKIIEEYEKRDSQKPFFLFEVTMQNHSSYTDNYDNFSPDITIDGVSSESLTNYLSLIKLSDEAIEELLGYFEAQQEPTLVVFFGDHQPTNSVVEPIWKLQGKSGGSLTDAEEALRYKVPFFIWANYEIHEESHVETSANYLAVKMLSLAGIPLSPYQNFLSSLEQTFPVISSIRAEDKGGNSYTIKEQREALGHYEALQYYQLFDS